jgi:hypothetical protein
MSAHKEEKAGEGKEPFDLTTLRSSVAPKGRIYVGSKQPVSVVAPKGRGSESLRASFDGRIWQELAFPSPLSLGGTASRRDVDKAWGVVFDAATGHSTPTRYRLLRLLGDRAKAYRLAGVGLDDAVNYAARDITALAASKGRKA